MPDRMSEQNSHEMPNRMPDGISAHSQKECQIRMLKDLSGRMPARMSAYMSERMPEMMPDRMSELQTKIDKCHTEF